MTKLPVRFGDHSSEHPALLIAGDLHCTSAPLDLLRRDGAEAFSQFSGDFTVIYSERGRTIAGRSMDSTHPLFINQDQRTLSSDELLFNKEGPRKLNGERVAQMLIGDYSDPHTTFYQGVSRIPQGRGVIITEGKIREIEVERPWSELEVEEAATLEDAADSLRCALNSMVRRSLEGAARPGSACSGGLDSSTLTLLSRQIRPTDSLTLTFSDFTESDEVQFARLVTAIGNGQEIYQPMTPCPPVTDTDRIYPQANLGIQRELFQLSHQHGIDHLLLGTGGDMVIGHGYGRISALALQGRLLSSLKLAHQAASVLPEATTHEVAKAWSIRPLVPERLLAMKRRFTGQTAREVAPWIDPDFAKEQHLRERINHAWERATTSYNSVKAHHRAGLADPYLGTLRDGLHQLASTYDLTIHFPFLTTEVVKACLSMPSQEILRGGWSRRQLREATKELLPEEVRMRPDKATFSGFFHACNRADPERLRAGVRSEIAAPYVVRETIEKETERYLAGDDSAWRGPFYVGQLVSQNIDSGTTT